MDDIEEHILKIKVVTSEVKIQYIQEVLKKIKDVRSNQKHEDKLYEYCSDVLETLWSHLENGFKEFEDQLLCSTCFYTILTFSNAKDQYLKLILNVLECQLNFKEKGTEVTENISRTTSLIYGIFQSSILITESKDLILASILDESLKLITLMAYDYSPFTFITFKIMTLFKKVIDTGYQDAIFNKKYNLNLLHIVNHNWENPITGVRGLNKIIFQNLISVFDKEMLEFILQELNRFYWNKAKYLMFSAIIEKYQGNITTLILEYDLVKGLIYSLHKTGLVSAGADMYISIVKKLNSENEWCTIFLSVLVEVIDGSSVKPIENFYNYWCLNTLKTFPSLMRTIFEEIEELKFAKYKLYSCLNLIVQGTRLGLEKNLDYTDIEDCVFSGIEHSDAYIRIPSFDIICGSQKKVLKGKKKYDLILDFLRNNVNSDCSVLRISMIESLQKSLIQEHTMFVSYSQNDSECNIVDHFQDFLTFCIELQQFIIESLNFNGNYQRKVATIQITKVLFNSLKGISSKKQRLSNQPNTIVMDFLINKHYWILSEEQFIMKLINLLKDPTDDIREHVTDFLLNNYSDILCKKHFMDYLTQEALNCIKSRFFYQVVCGQVMFKLIVNLLLTKNGVEGQFKKVEDVFEFAYNVLKSESNLKVDIVRSINEGKQLHSYLSILYNIFEVSMEKSYKLDITTEVITSLLEILRNISNQFVWGPEEASVSSDFSKMNDMVENMIRSSKHQISNKNNETKLSGLHQIVLNCMWLNVKASCELSSILIKYYKDDSHTEVCEECLKIICHVLETSRHKGAIEAGGTTLGQAIQQLTSAPEGSNISKIPITLLKCKLNELISETSNMASVTRRGAGLSIMIHRIVSSDMNKRKPLFHYFMQVLLDTCKNASETSNRDNEVDSSDAKDLPKAIYIHFLTRIVIDSSLASVMLYYSDKLAEIAFDNLSSSCWQIRNAALQLYGSLIPKLIGQKKNSGTGEEVIATVAIDEFRTHSPKLWGYIVIQLKDISNVCDIVQSHNNLVPILSIFANMAPMYSFASEKQINKAILPSFLSLLGSPIYVVRRLTAKCILNIYSFETIFDILLNATCETESCLHGTLMLLNVFIKQYNDNINIKEISDNLKWKFQNILKSKNHSYLCKESFENVFPECINLTENMIKETLSEIDGQKYSQGIFLWANFRIQKYLENATWCEITEIVTLIENCSDFEMYCGTLCKRIENEKLIPEEVLLELSDTLYILGFKRKSNIIWKTLYEVSLKTQLLNKQLDSLLLFRYLVENELSYRTRYMLPFAGRYFMNTTSKELLLVSNIVFKLCNPEIADVEMRLIAAMANNELANKFANLSNHTKINAIKAAIMLLQDEDEDVRNCSVHFYRQVSADKVATHPYICLQKMLSNDFLNIVCGIQPSEIESVCIDLMDLLNKLTMCNEEEYNPFANESKNIYLEPEVLKQKIGELDVV